MLPEHRELTTRIIQNTLKTKRTMTLVDVKFIWLNFYCDIYIQNQWYFKILQITYSSLITQCVKLKYCFERATESRFRSFKKNILLKVWNGEVFLYDTKIYNLFFRSDILTFINSKFLNWILINKNLNIAPIFFISVICCTFMVH